MPDVIRRGSSPTVVVTISTVIDQSTLNPVSPTVSAIVNGAAATITAWAWKVNGSTSGIAGPTTATPTYTPTTKGEKAITCDVTISGVVYASTPEYFIVGPNALSATIDAISDQSTLDPVAFDVDVTGGVTPYTYAWTVNAATTGLDNATIEGPTYTPPAAQGRKTVACLITDAAGQTCQATPRSFVVGPTAFSIALTAVADSNGLSTATLTATPTGGVTPITYAWTLLGPDETSQTTLIVDATAASTTAVLASIASGQRAGMWTAQCIATDTAGQSVTKTVQWQVGAKVSVNASLVWMYLHATIDFTAEATLSYLADDGAQVIGGYDFTSGNSAKADALGVVNGSGLRIVAKTSSDWVAGSRTAPFVDVALTELDSTWTTGTIFAVQTVYSWATAPAANDVGLRFFGCTETSTTISGEYMTWILDGYSGGSINTAINTVVDATGSSYTSLVGPSHALEIESFSGMVKFRRATSDPGSTVAAPGTWTAVAVSATADDDGPVAWQRRLGGVAPETDAKCRVGWTIHRSATGNAADIYVERLYYWKAA